jgi:hypothetical protein
MAWSEPARPQSLPGLRACPAQSLPSSELAQLRACPAQSLPSSPACGQPTTGGSELRQAWPMVRRSRSTTSRHRKQRGSVGLGARLVTTVAGVLGVVLLLGLALHLTGKPEEGGTLPRPLPPAASTVPDLITGETAPVNRQWSAVLDVIDNRRATAWRLGRPRLLRSVYAPGSAELRADRELLSAYARRGLRVSGVTMRFLSVRVQSAAHRSASLLVVDQLEPAVAIDRSGRRHPLPRDVPTRHRIELRMVGQNWRIASVAVVES